MSAPTPLEPHSFSADGRVVVGRDGVALGLVSLLLEPDATPEVLFRTPFTERNPEISPDGRWLAYESEQTGRPEVYVRPFPNVHDSVVQITTEGGSLPLWSAEGNELFCCAGARVMAVPIRTGTSFTWGAPSVAIEGCGSTNPTRRDYDTRDGQRFVTVKFSADAGIEEIVVVQNWIEEVRRKVGR